MKQITLFIVLVFVFVFPLSISAQGEPLKVVATTSIIADVARNVGGEQVEVTALVPPDSDIHAYQPTPADVAMAAEADLILTNGAGLEAFLGGLLKNASARAPIAVSNGIQILSFGHHPGEDEHGAEEPVTTEGAELPEEYIGILGVDAECASEDAHAEGDDEHAHGDCDPHVWTDPNNVIIWANNIAEALAGADAVNGEIYRANADAYIEKLQALDEEVAQILSVIPDNQRVLVTNHEFFAYFAYRYRFEVVGVVIPGGSTLAEPDPQQIAALVQLIRDKGVPAIFVEISASDRLAQAVARETGIGVVTALYSDALSRAGGPASTYIDYMRYNARIIAGALGGIS